jgi:putative endonuclease
MNFWVYLIRCSDGSYYTGHTDNLESRIAQHVTGAIPSCHTFSRRPVECVFSQDFATREEALVSEQQIKGWGRKKKEAMIRGDWAEVSRLARSSVRPETVEGRIVVRQAHHERQISDSASAHHDRQTFDSAEAHHERRTSVSPAAQAERQTSVRPEPVEGQGDKS